jgi:hypothetical protein
MSKVLAAIIGLICSRSSCEHFRMIGKREACSMIALYKLPEAGCILASVSVPFEWRCAVS